MDNTPKVSIIVPVYNAEKYIAAGLESLINQTVRNLEIIIVDDLGDDRSMSIVESYAKKDNRIQVVRHDINRGAAAGRNTGIRCASAPFIMFMDADDYYMPDMCEKMLNAIESTGADWAACGTNVLYDGYNAIALKKTDIGYFKIRFNGLNEMSEDIFYNTDVCPWNKIYRRCTILDKYLRFPEGVRCEDEYWFRVYGLYAKTIYFLPEKLYCYRRIDSGVMGKMIDKENEFNIHMLKNAFAFWDHLKRRGMLKERWDYAANSLFILLRSAFFWSQTDKSTENVYKTAYAFVKKEHLSVRDFKEPLQEQFKMLLNGSLDKYSKQFTETSNW